MFPPHSTLILLSTGVGVGLDFAGINRVKALYWTAVINGLLAPSFSPPGVSCHILATAVEIHPLQADPGLPTQLFPRARQLARTGKFSIVNLHGDTLSECH
jgi:hypothetical protein